MHRLFLGCNLWNALFLTAAVWLGLSGSRHHVRVSVFAAVFACMIQSGIIALFLGAAKLAKEHVGRFNMPLDLIGRINEVYHKLIPIAAIGTVWMATAAIVGGLSDLQRVPALAHGALAFGVYLYLMVIIPVEYRLQSKLHGVLQDIERLVPPAEEHAAAPSHPLYNPDRIVMDSAGRARALLYIGLTLPLPYLGYTFIAGRDMSLFLIPTILLTLICLAASAHQFRSARGGGHR